jgi:hypothetical protein
LGFEIEGFARSEQDYKPNTAILRTRLYDHQGRGTRSRISRRVSAVGSPVPTFDAHSPVKVISGTPRVRAGAATLDWGRRCPR